MSRYAAGQTWAYATRAGEESSRLTVLRVDETAHAGVIVHVAVEGIRLDNPAAPERPPTAIGFMPIAEASLDGSVTELLHEDAAFSPRPDFAEGYANWREAFDAGKAGFWTAPVARIIQSIEDGMKRGR